MYSSNSSDFSTLKVLRYTVCNPTATICCYQCMSSLVFDIAAGNFCHCCNVNLTIILCNVVYVALPFLNRECHSKMRCRSLTGQYSVQPPVVIVQTSCSNLADSYNIHSFQICTKTIARQANSYTSQFDAKMVSNSLDRRMVSTNPKSKHQLHTLTRATKFLFISIKSCMDNKCNYLYTNFALLVQSLHA